MKWFQEAQKNQLEVSERLLALEKKIDTQSTSGESTAVDMGVKLVQSEKEPGPSTRGLRKGTKLASKKDSKLGKANMKNLAPQLLQTVNFIKLK